MKLICPYVWEHPYEGREAARVETYEWVVHHGGDLIDVSGSDYAYHDLLARLWSEGDGLILVEHDVVPSEEGYESLKRCRKPWCALPYPIGPHAPNDAHMAGDSLGCTKFSGRLMRRFPGVMEEAADHPRGAGMPPRHWTRLDTRIWGVLNDYGLRPHVHDHWPARHLHHYA